MRSLINKIIITSLLIIIVTCIWLHIGLKAHAQEGKIYTLHIYEGTERQDIVTQGRYIKYMSDSTVIVSSESLDMVYEEISEEVR